MSHKQRLTTSREFDATGLDLRSCVRDLNLRHGAWPTASHTDLFEFLFQARPFLGHQTLRRRSPRVCPGKQRLRTLTPLSTEESNLVNTLIILYAPGSKKAPLPFTVSNYQGGSTKPLGHRNREEKLK